MPNSLRAITHSLLLGLAVLLPASATAQPLPFGSSDDPSEHIRSAWREKQNSLDVLGGFSLIGPRWRTLASVNANIITRSFGARLRTGFRVGSDGRYRPDFDEPYDLLRQIDFIRLNRSLRRGVYLRVGPIQRGRLGDGHLVNFFNSAVAWDERTIGAEMMLRSGPIDVAGFTDNVLVNGVAGGRVAVRPLTWSSDARAQTFEVGFSVVTDLARNPADVAQLTGFNADISFAAAHVGEAHVAPFASVGWYKGFGGGLAAGASFKSDNFLDLARFNLKLAILFDANDFYSGYVGSFYAVQNGRSRILETDSGDPIDPDRTVGLLLSDVESGTGYEIEFRVVFFERFELWWQFRRRGPQPLSERHFRLLFQTSRLRASFEQDRSGLRGLFSVFNDLGDQTALSFETEYLVTRSFWVVVRARYSYERVGDAPDGTRRFLVQRRFEPLGGLRIRF